MYRFVVSEPSEIVRHTLVDRVTCRTVRDAFDLKRQRGVVYVECISTGTRCLVLRP